MADPLKAAFAALGTAFAAGVAWMTLKAKVDRVHGDLNRMGRERVKKVEDDMKTLTGRVDEQREQHTTHREQAFTREAELRERVAKLETALDSVLDLMRAERTDRTERTRGPFGGL